MAARKSSRVNRKYKTSSGRLPRLKHKCVFQSQTVEPTVCFSALFAAHHASHQATVRLTGQISGKAGCPAQAWTCACPA